MRLLIIEDSERLRKSLQVGFTRLGYTVVGTGDGKEGLHFALNNDYDVIILDIMLPSLDGLNVLKQLRDRKKNTSVVILSAKDQIDDRIKGLDVGADDYLCKPFSFDELHARVRSLVRRAHQVGSPNIEIGLLCIDLSLHEAIFDGSPINFTPHEYTILEHLALNLGRVITYASLEDYLYNDHATVTRNAIEAHISAIRRKLKQAGSDPLIKTRRGFGYFIEKDTQV